MGNHHFSVFRKSLHSLLEEWAMIIRIEKRFITRDMAFHRSWVGDQLRKACEEYMTIHNYTPVSAMIERRYEELATGETVFIVCLKVKGMFLMGGI